MSLVRVLSSFVFLFTFSLQASDSLRVGLTGKYPPFNYFDEQGTLSGFDVEISQELCRRLQKKCEFKILQWDGILSALLAHRLDVIVGSMAVTPEREKAVNFSIPYYVSGAQLFLKKGLSKKPETDSLNIGVTLGTTYGVFAKRKFPLSEIKTYKGDVEALQDVLSGRLDGLITDKLVGLHMVKSFAAPLETYGELLFEERIAIPLIKENTLLLQMINEELAEIKNSEFYSSLWQKYFNQRLEVNDSFKWSQAITLLLKSLLNTLALSFSGILGGLLLAVFLAAMTLADLKYIRYFFSAYVDFIRATPFLVQLFAIYFGLPAMGIKLSPWTAAILSIAIHSAAYLSEILKSSYLSIPLGQRWAAQSLGISRMETLKRVIFPQMLPVMLPPMLNTVVAMVKDSAIVSVISVHELTLQAQELISATFRPLEFYVLTAFLYFLVTYPLLLVGKKLELRFKRKGLLNAA